MRKITRKTKVVKTMKPRKKETLPEDVDELPPASKEDIPKVKSPDTSALQEPLGEGQRYFEAPSGKIYVGSADIDRMLVREDGKEIWINPKR